MFNLGKKFIGLEISDSAIKLVETEKTENGFHILNKIRQNLSEGLVDKGVIKDEEGLLMAFNKILNSPEFKEISTDEYIFGFPESLLFTHVFFVSKDEESQLEEIAKKEAKSSIPIGEEDLISKYFLLEQTKENAQKVAMKSVLLIATKKSQLLMWQNFFNKASIKIVAFDLESLSLLRICFAKNPEKPVCLIDLGGLVTNTYIFNNNGVYFADSIKFGGDNIKFKLMEYYDLKSKKIDDIEAEKIVKEIGLNDKTNTESGAVIEQSLKPIIENTIELLKYYQQRNGDEIKEIYITGGTSRMKGLRDFFQGIFSKIDLKNYIKGTILKTWGSDVNLVNFASGIVIKEADPVVEDVKNQSEFFEAVGLSMKMLSENSYDEISVPLLSLSEEEEKQKQEGEKRKMEKEHVDKKLIWIKTHPKESKLIAILLIGVFLVGGSFWYRGYSKKNQKIGQSGQEQIFFTKQLDIKLPISYTQTSGQTKVKLFERIIKEPIDYDIALELSKMEANKKLLANEKIWPNPINKSTLDLSPLPPYPIQLIIYDEPLVNSAFLNQVKRQVGATTTFIMKSLSLNEIVKDSTNQFYFLGQIIIESEKEIPAADISDARSIAGTSELSASTSIPTVATVSTSTEIVATSTEIKTATSVSQEEKKPEIKATTSEEKKPEVKAESNISTQNSEKPVVATTTAAAKVKYKTVTSMYRLKKRTGPGMEYPYKGILFDDVTLPYIEEKNGYTKVSGSSGIFWLCSEYLTFNK